MFQGGAILTNLSNEAQQRWLLPLESHCTLTSNIIEPENKTPGRGYSVWKSMILWFDFLVGTVVFGEIYFQLRRICLKFECLSSTSFLSLFCMPPEAALGQSHCATLNRPDVLGVAPKKTLLEKGGRGFWVLIFRIQLRNCANFRH